MGGVFSGQRASKKRVVESCNAIDTAEFNRWGALKVGTKQAGTLEWRRGDDQEPSSSVGYTLGVESAAGVLCLRYQMGQPAQSFDYPVRLVTTGCHLGGRRWWFLCPLTVNRTVCGRRVRKLYLRGNYFGCRYCHRLAYRSSQQSDSRVYATVRGGLDLDGLTSVEGLSVSQLGFALKVLTFEQKRLDRLDKRLKRPSRRKRTSAGQ